MLDSDDHVDNEVDCTVHPRMDNWRLQRTLRALKWWSMEDEGYTHPNCNIRPLNQGDGWLHRRVVTSILFEYEIPYLEMLYEHGAFVRKECERDIMDTIPEMIKLTPIADDLLKSWGVDLFRLDDTLYYYKDGKIKEEGKIQVVEA